MPEKDISILNLLIAGTIIGILAALIIPNAIVAIQGRKANIVYHELSSIENDTQNFLKLVSLAEQGSGPYAVNLDYKDAILKSFPLDDEFDKKSAFLFMSEEGKNELISINNRLDEAIKAGKTIITREDAIIMKLDIMDTKIDELGKTIIDRWDVAVVIFYILGGFVALLTIFGIFNKIFKKGKNR